MFPLNNSSRAKTLHKKKQRIKKSLKHEHILQSNFLLSSSTNRELHRFKGSHSGTTGLNNMLAIKTASMHQNNV